MRALPRCDGGSGYWGGCGALARFRIERPGEGYSPTEACPAHVADAMAWMLDGDDVPLTVHVHFDEQDESPPRGRSEASAPPRNRD